VSTHREQIIALCERFDVASLAAFGSAVGDEFDETRSDVDLVVEFMHPGSAEYADNYFSLKAALEDLFGRPVDLVTRSSIVNPYFVERVESTQEAIYAA
jgi:predicted nucleotidyltransferase